MKEIIENGDFYARNLQNDGLSHDEMMPFSVRYVSFQRAI
jgi:hypothetical protein